MKLIVNENFQYRGFRRVGTILTLASMILVDEFKKGKHPETGKYISGLLEHCSPADKETENFLNKLLNGEKVEVSSKVTANNDSDNGKEIRDLWAEFETLGTAYDRRWGVDRLRNELKKAKILAGQEKDEQEKTEIITE